MTKKSATYGVFMYEIESRGYQEVTVQRGTGEINIETPKTSLEFELYGVFLG